jgi:ABC-2 type transport system ATP-binding protein
MDEADRLSNRIAIMDHGKLISQAPIEELLNSNSQPIFNLGLKGDTENTRLRISSLPWVTNIQSKPVNNHISWAVSVSDEEVAEAQLLKQVLSGDEVTVLEFGRRKVDLEDIFLTLTEGDQNGNHE